MLVVIGVIAAGHDGPHVSVEHPGLCVASVVGCARRSARRAGGGMPRRAGGGNSRGSGGGCAGRGGTSAGPCCPVGGVGVLARLGIGAGTGRFATSPVLEGRADGKRAREAVGLLVGERARRG